jgi:hypothetical protein
VTSTARREEMQRLGRIRRLLDAIAPGDWLRADDADGAFMEARGQHGELQQVARFHPGATLDEIEFAAAAPGMVRFLLELVDRAIETHRKARREQAAQERPVGKDYAAEAAMKCQEPAFRVFLAEQHGLTRPLTDERVAQKVRSLCGVTSRRDLNDGGTASARWKDLRAAFDAWKRAGH